MSASIYESLRRRYAGVSRWRAMFFAARWRICPFEELAGLVPHASRIAEFGCGQGIFSHVVALMRPEAKIVGVDSAPDRIRAAMESAGDMANLRFVCDDVRRLPANEPFDVVAMIDVIHHVPYADQQEALRVAYRSLRPGGTLFIKDIAERPRWRVWASFLHDMLQNHRPFFLKENDLRALIAGAGFEINREWRKDTWHIPHLLFIARKPETA